MIARMTAFILLVVLTVPTFVVGRPAVQSTRTVSEAAWVKSTLQRLSLRQRIGQMIVLTVIGEFTNLESPGFKEVRQAIEQMQVGGFIVKWGDVHGVAALLNEMQRISPIPMLIAADFERGLRMRVRNGTPFTNNMGVGATGDPRAAYEQGRITAVEMRALGVNWLFGPVADINNNPDNPVINVRSFGEDPAQVGRFVAEAVRGIQATGVLATAKHFPGHGDTAVDSHIGLAKIQGDRDRLDHVELVPFRAAIKAGVASIMTAHIAVPGVTGDDTPATLSPRITTDLLRRDLNFNGLIVTDAMEMGAIAKNYPESTASVMAVKAGADIVLTPPDPHGAIAAIEAAVKNGEISEERINASVRRILQAKYRIGLHRQHQTNLSQISRIVEHPDNVRLAEKVTEDSMTLLRNQQNMLPLNPEQVDRAFIAVLAADDDPEEGRSFVAEVRRRAPQAKVWRADPRTGVEEYKKRLAEAAQAERIIVAQFVKRAALKGTVAVPEQQAEFIRQLIALGKPVATIAFGSPYLIRQFPEAPVYMVTYAIEDIAQVAATRAIFGEIKIAGRLPVSIPGLFELGAGLIVAPTTASR